MAKRNCKNCSKEYVDYPSWNRQYCSHRCYTDFRKKSGKYVAWNKGKKVQTNSGRTHFKKGQKPYHAGKKLPERSGENHHFWGKKRPLKTKLKISKSRRGKMRGEKHFAWKGGTGTQRHQAMGKWEYRVWRDAVFFKDNYTCQMCDEYGGYLHADHIKSWSKFPELRFEVSNGRTLCRACHYYITFKRKLPIGSRWGLTRGE